jgi:hypothetical protein
MHRIEIEQIADHDLRTYAAQRLSAFVFISHHRTHRFALFQQQFGDGAPYRADPARRAGDQNRALFRDLTLLFEMDTQPSWHAWRSGRQ